MATNSNPLNVYKGPAALQHYFDPDQQPPLPLVELPEKLNPFYGDGVRIYAKIMSMHPANNVKAIPAINLLSHTVVPGKTKTVIEYSSGSTVISMSMVARIFHGITDTRAFLSNKTSKAKLQLMQFFGLGLTLFGGPSQPQPLDPRGGIQDAKRRAMDSEEIVNPNQYGNDSNWQAHVRWTGPQILKQLPEINVICAGMGTSGTMSGLATYFKQTKPSVRTVGVCTAPGDRVPGPRSFDLIQQLTFPWRNVVDVIEEVGAVESFALSLQLCREGVICGPSSGFNLKGLLITVEKMKAAGTLQPLRGTDNGLIHCVFLCCDLPYQYIGEYFSKLGKESFPPIRNERLAKVDLYRYDESWEKEPGDVAEGLSKPGSNKQPLDWQVVDLRLPKDFAAGHLPLAINIPLATLCSASDPSPFTDANVLEAQWLELEDIFAQECTINKLKARNKEVMVICYGGDTARVAASIMRAKGIEASSVRGGFAALMDKGAVSVCSSVDALKWYQTMLWRLITGPLRLFSK